MSRSAREPSGALVGLSERTVTGEAVRTILHFLLDIDSGL